MTKGSTGRRARAEAARLLEAASRSLDAGRNEEAVRSLLEADRATPNDPEVLARLGRGLLATGRVRQAVDVLRRSIALRPDAAGEVHGRLGLALEAGGDDGAAVLAYREAVRRSPDLVDTQGRLADLLFQRGLRSEAAAAYESASALDPGSQLSRRQKAMAYIAMDRLEDAERELRDASEADPTDGVALQLLGLVLQIRGGLSEAGAVYQRAIEADPLNASAYHGLFTSKKVGEGDRASIAKVLSLLEAKDWHAPLSSVDVERRRMSLHFTVGKALDDLGDYAAAMTHFDAANALRRRIVPFDRGAMERRVERLTKRYTREVLAHRSAVGCADRTPILIVGLPRSGTSLLERVLSSHPEVTGCGELDYWNERGPRWADAEPGALAKAAGGLKEGYLTVLRRGAPTAARATDKMPFNFFWVGLVHLLFPDAVIVHCRRNPVDTCLSIYITQFSTVWDFASSLGDLAAYHHLYRRLMDHWRAVLPADRFVEVDYEDVVGAPEKAARSLLAFCGLPWDPGCLHPESNRQTVATASQWQARQPIYGSSVERWRHYEPWIGELKDLL